MTKQEYLAAVKTLNAPQTVNAVSAVLRRNSLRAANLNGYGKLECWGYSYVELRGLPIGLLVDCVDIELARVQGVRQRRKAGAENKERQLLLEETTTLVRVPNNKLAAVRALLAS